MGRTIKSTLKTFLENTSVKGVGRILKTHNVFLKLFWLLAVVFGLCFALFNIISLLLRYSDFNTVSDLFSL